MKQLIESRKTIYDIIDCLNTEQSEIVGEASWHSYSSQPNVKIIEQPTIYSKGATISKVELGSMSAKEIITVSPKANQYFGALINEDLTTIYLPRKSKYLLYSWGIDEQLIKYESSIKDRFIAIEGNIPFAIMSESILNPPLLFFFNKKPKSNFFQIHSSMDSNNSKSKYFI